MGREAIIYFRLNGELQRKRSSHYHPARHGNFYDYGVFDKLFSAENTLNCPFLCDHKGFQLGCAQIALREWQRDRRGSSRQNYTASFVLDDDPNELIEKAMKLRRRGVMRRSR